MNHVDCHYLLYLCKCSRNALKMCAIYTHIYLFRCLCVQFKYCNVMLLSLHLFFDSHTGLSNTVITLTGSGFGSDTSLISVEIDGVACNVATVTDTQVTCAVGEHAGGTFAIMLQHKVKGYAKSEVAFKYEFQLSGVVPSEGNAFKFLIK